MGRAFLGKLSAKLPAIERSTSVDGLPLLAASTASVLLTASTTTTSSIWTF